MIYTFGDVSGAHFDPPVTVGLAVARRFHGGKFHSIMGAPIRGTLGKRQTEGVVYTGSGAWSYASRREPITKLHFGSGADGNSHADDFERSTGAKEKVVIAGIAIGSVIGLEAMFAGTICGASMNPARYFAPAIVSAHLEHLLIYLLAPVVGVCIAVPLCMGVRERGCC